MKVSVTVKDREHGRHTVSVSENMVDRVVAFFDPIRGRERLRARVMTAVTGSYFGGSTTRRSLSEWVTTAWSADTDLLYDLPRLRERSRDLCRNSPLAAGAVATNRISVIGTGLRLNPSIDREFLRLDDVRADAVESAMSREWNLFWNAKDIDVARILDGAAISDQVYDQVLQNGEAIILMPRVDRPNCPYNLRLQVIEADRLSNPQIAATSATLIGGVEKDANGAPVAYHIQDQHPGNMLFADPKQGTWTRVPAYGPSTGLPNAIHLYEQKRPGQTRGIPYLTPVVETLKQLSRYTEAEIMAAVVAGMFTVFIRSEEGDAELDTYGTGSSGTGSTSVEDQVKLSNGGIVGLAPNEDISTANPGRPNSGYDPFVTSILREIGVGLNMPFEILTKHFTSSYSASRAALLEAWRFFKTRRSWFAANFLDVVYQKFMWDAVALGRIPAPGFFADPAIRAAYLSCEWIGDAQGMLDPVKEINAAERRVALVVSTRSRETAELTGGDFERNVRQARKERQLLRDAGINPDGAAAAASPPAPPPSGEPEEAADMQDDMDDTDMETAGKPAPGGNR